MKIALISSLIVSSIFFVGCSDSASGAKKVLERRVTDPSSLQYRNIASYSEGFTCGEFNSKNKFGGYVGFIGFIYDEAAPNEINISPDTDEVKYLCVNKSDKALRLTSLGLLKNYADIQRELPVAIKNLERYSQEKGDIEKELVDVEGRCLAYRESGGEDHSNADCVRMVNLGNDLISIDTKMRLENLTIKNGNEFIAKNAELIKRLYE